MFDLFRFSDKFLVKLILENRLKICRKIDEKSIFDLF